MKHEWFRHKNAICIFGFLFLQLHCKKSSSDTPPPLTPPASSASGCASGLAALTFEATPVLPAVDPRTLKTQNTALQLADTGNGTYTKFQLSCDTDPNAEVIRWKACAVSSGAGCYPKDQEWSVMFECGDLPSLQELQGQVVRFTVQSCIPQHRDQARIQNHQSVDANELSCESPGQEFIFKLPSNFSDYNAKYDSVMDELYGLKQKYMDIGKQIYAASKEPAMAAASTASSGLALADGTTDASLKSVVQTKATETLPQWAKSFRNAGPYMVGYLAANRDSVSSEASNEVQENQAAINAGASSLSLASTDPLSSCAGAISSLNDTPVDTSTQTAPPPVFTPAPAPTPQDEVTDTAWGPNTCHADQEWNGESNACINRCPTGQTWNDGQGTCDSPATDTDTTSSSNAAKRGGMIFGGAVIATIGLIILFRTPFSGLRNHIIKKWNYRYQIRGKLRAMDFLQKPTGSISTVESLELWKSPDIRSAAKQAGLTEANFKKGLSSEHASSLRENLHGKGVEPSVKFENLKVEMQTKFMEPGAKMEFGNRPIEFANKLDLKTAELKEFAGKHEKIRFKELNVTNEHGKSKFKPTEGGKWLSRLGGVLVLAGIVIAVLGAVTQLAGDTGGVTGYMQNLVDIDQQTLELGDQIVAQSTALDTLLATERAAHPGKKH